MCGENGNNGDGPDDDGPDDGGMGPDDGGDARAAMPVGENAEGRRVTGGAWGIEEVNQRTENTGMT